MYVYIFQSDPRVVFSVADVLACHRETRWYSDNAGVVFSVADVSLSSADSRSTVLMQLTRSHRLLLCSRSSLSSADSTVRQFQLTLALCSPFAQLRRSPLLNVFSRTYVALSFPFLASSHLSSLSNAVVNALYRANTC